MKVLVTGADGFIGRNLCSALLGSHEIIGSVRTNRAVAHCRRGVHVVVAGPLGPATEWESALDGVEVVIHLAGRAHILRDRAPDPASEFYNVNVLGTKRLALEAARCGVRLFLFLSSVGVHGRHSEAGAFTEALQPAPVDDYAISKWQAEQALHRIATETGMSTVVVRPPLVYGPEVPGNFRSLLRLIRRALPLPLGRANAARSLIGVDNLVSFLQLCIESTEATGRTFLVSDGENLSVADLCRTLASGMNIPLRLLPMPPGAVFVVARAAGRERTYDQLFRPLTVDSRAARTVLGWSPTRSLADGLNATARWFASTQE